MQFILDCSVSISWCLVDEASTYTDTVLALLEEAEAIVPMIWHAEMANTLVVSERRERLTQLQTNEAIAFLRSLPISIDMETSANAWNRTLELARQYNLAAYAAAYLELTLRKQLLLATIDNKLAEAAKDCGVFLQPHT
jgi:predicted nucleic acid-binding protein